LAGKAFCERLPRVARKTSRSREKSKGGGEL
jgi:hypothetical protein